MAVFIVEAIPVAAPCQVGILAWALGFAKDEEQGAAANIPCPEVFVVLT